MNQILMIDRMVAAKLLSSCGDNDCSITELYCEAAEVIGADPDMISYILCYEIR
jgi:hypothetical protein